MLFQNAFSERLGPHGFEFHSLFTPDLLHEFELGVWKAVFTHLIRLLYAVGGDGIQILNERYMTFDSHFSQSFNHYTYNRYRDIPTFGRGTIRKFNNNVSAMKKMAARDFEDLLQVDVKHNNR